MPARSWSTARLEDIFNHDEHHPYTKGLFDSIPSLDVDDAPAVIPSTA